MTEKIPNTRYETREVGLNPEKREDKTKVEKPKNMELNSREAMLIITSLTALRDRAVLRDGATIKEEAKVRELYQAVDDLIRKIDVTFNPEE